MNNFFKFVTPEEYYKLQESEEFTLQDLERRAKLDGTCEVCGQHVWRLVDNDLCFSCTTGEADASSDYEIGEPYL